MTTTPLTRLLIFLCRRLLSKLETAYTKSHGQKLPIILVAGTAGKSSTTLSIKRLFEHAGWKVYSGAKEQSCLNSLTGLIMTLGEFEMHFEGKGSKIRKIEFVLRAFWLLIKKQYHPQVSTALIYEIGFNEQNESNWFTPIFKDKAELLVITGLTLEHPAGFDDVFDNHGFVQLENTVPDQLKVQFLDQNIDPRLKNIALEQLKLHVCATSFIYPGCIGDMTNEVLYKIASSQSFKSHDTEVERGERFELIADKQYRFSNRYLLPLTFAKLAYILELISDMYHFDHNHIHAVLGELVLPNGRFSLLEGVIGSWIVDSTYNSDPASIHGFLDMFEEVVESYKSLSYNEKEYDLGGIGMVMPPKHYLILGEMRELGEVARDEHERILTRLIQIGKHYGDYIQDIILLGQEWLKLDDGIKKTDNNLTYISFDKQIFKVYLRAGDITQVLPNDIIRPQSWFWIKGSQNTIYLEIVVEYLLAHKEDKKYLCRQGERWEQEKAMWK